MQVTMMFVHFSEPACVRMSVGCSPFSSRLCRTPSLPMLQRGAVLYVHGEVLCYGEADSTIPG